MQAVFERIDQVECVGNKLSYTLRPCEFEDCIDSIIIRTEIKETDLKRGWTGDLHWFTSKAFSTECFDTDYIESDVFKDVILTHIKPYYIYGQTVAWEYVFMKK